MWVSAGARATPTMMIMGEICTRGCSFCNVITGRPDARPVEPGRVAHAVQKLGLKHVVISVDATIWKMAGPSISPQVIRAIRHRSPGSH